MKKIPYDRYVGSGIVHAYTLCNFAPKRLNEKLCGLKGGSPLLTGHIFRHDLRKLPSHHSKLPKVVLGLFTMSTTKIRLWLVKETDLARQYCKFNPFVSVSGIEHGNSMEDTDLIWIPQEHHPAHQQAGQRARRDPAGLVYRKGAPMTAIQKDAAGSPQL